MTGGRSLASFKALSLMASCVLLGTQGCTQQASTADPGAGLAKNVAKPKVSVSEYPERVFWGDLHLHTSDSVDAFGYGTRLKAEDAFRFARGYAVTSTTGIRAQLDRPLDFLAITDHSEALGASRALYEMPRESIGDPVLLRWHDLMHAGGEQAKIASGEIIRAVVGGTMPASLATGPQADDRVRSIWQSQIDIAERYNEPGKFTALLGFEYTLMDGGANLHRNVIFRDGPAKVRPQFPIEPGTLTTPDALWDYMDAYERGTGGRVLAIPHNSNLSNGRMFTMTQADGGPMSASTARRRAMREPLVEITQIKGTSETHPFLSPNDEFAAFSIAGWDIYDLMNAEKKQPDMFAGEYVRSALRRGLEIARKAGANPYQFGVVGSTDSHTALSSADDNRFFGSAPQDEPNAQRGLASRLRDNQRQGWQYYASGYAAIWARANTREELFDAMMRRETYATTGPRMTIRFFGGWDFRAGDLAGGLGHDWVRDAYRRGVPMGGMLHRRGGGSPRFLISTLKDPLGANLDRVQIVKGWIDARGTTHERVFDAVWSEPAKRRVTNGQLTPVDDSVDLATASYRNTIGAVALSGVWTDPEFDPSQRAFYYLRVIEIPTPSWVAYDAVKYGYKLPPSVIAKHQERGYTSPIWYEPQAR